MSNSIEKLVGQLIIAGFRGKSIKNDSPIVNYIKNFNIAGIILYDIDLEIGGNNLNRPHSLKSLQSIFKIYLDKNYLFLLTKKEATPPGLNQFMAFLKIHLGLMWVN